MKFGPLHQALPAVLTICMWAPINAQQLYRCGNTYSQQPCDKSAEPKSVFSDKRVAPPTSTSGAELCRAAVPQSASLKDPYSARIDSIGKATPEVIRFAEQPIMARRYDVLMNSKNSYGAYTGAKIYRCYLSENHTKVLQVVGSEPER